MCTLKRVVKISIVELFEHSLFSYHDDRICEKYVLEYICMQKQMVINWLIYGWFTIFPKQVAIWTTKTRKWLQEPMVSEAGQKWMG